MFIVYIAQDKPVEDSAFVIVEYHQSIISRR